MILQNTTLLLENSLFGIVGIGFIMFHIVFSIWLYNKARRWILIGMNFMFSIILMFTTFQYNVIMSPLIQFFDIMINGILFMMVSIQAFDGRLK
jgi:hypothetical protein